MDLALKGNILDSAAQLALYRNALPEYLLRKISMSYPPPMNIEEWMTRAKEIDLATILQRKFWPIAKEERLKLRRRRRTSRRLMLRTTHSTLTNFLSRKDRSCKTRDYVSGAGSRDIFLGAVLPNPRNLVDLLVGRYDRLQKRIWRTRLRKSQMKKAKMKRTIFLLTHSELQISRRVFRQASRLDA